MSVVNKMLNDLENREQNAVVSADYQPPQKRRFPVVGLFLLVLVIAGGAWAYWQFSPVLLQDNAQNGGLNAGEETKVDLAESGGSQPSKGLDNVSSPRANINESSLSDLQVLAEEGIDALANDASDEKVELVTNNREQEVSTDAQVAALRDSNKEIEVPDAAMADTNEVAQMDVVMEKKRVVSNSPSAPANDLDNETVIATSGAREELPKETPAIMEVKSSDRFDESQLKLAAQKALADKDTDRAMTLLREILNGQPDNVNARKQLASLLFANQEQLKAETLLLTGLERNEQQHDMRLMLARLYQQSERSQQALALLQAVSPDVALNIEYYSQRASLSQRLNNFRQASQDYRTLATVEPEQAKWWLGVGVSADRLNDKGTAISAYTRALSLDQLDSRVTVFMQERLRGLGR